MNKKLWTLGLALTAVGFSPLFSEEEVVETKSALSCEECKCQEEEEIVGSFSSLACEKCNGLEEEEKIEG